MDVDTSPLSVFLPFFFLSVPVFTGTEHHLPLPLPAQRWGPLVLTRDTEPAQIPGWMEASLAPGAPDSPGFSYSGGLGCGVPHTLPGVERTLAPPCCQGNWRSCWYLDNLSCRRSSQHALHWEWWPRAGTNCTHATVRGTNRDGEVGEDNATDVTSSWRKGRQTAWRSHSWPAVSAEGLGWGHCGLFLCDVLGFLCLLE